MIDYELFRCQKEVEGSKREYARLPCCRPFAAPPLPPLKYLNACAMPEILAVLHAMRFRHSFVFAVCFNPEQCSLCPRG